MCLFRVRSPATNGALEGVAVTLAYACGWPSLATDSSHCQTLRAGSIPEDVDQLEFLERRGSSWPPRGGSRGRSNSSQARRTRLAGNEGRRSGPLLSGNWQNISSILASHNHTTTEDPTNSSAWLDVCGMPTSAEAETCAEGGEGDECRGGDRQQPKTFPQRVAPQRFHRGVSPLHPKSPDIPPPSHYLSDE
eukprot:1195673-Prorocentrum_minimum.AAC.1